MRPDPEVNQVMVSGAVASQVHRYPDRIVFMLHNPKGRFFVQYGGTPEETLVRGVRVMVQGSLFSVPVQGTDAGRIEAAQILVLR